MTEIKLPMDIVRLFDSVFRVARARGVSIRAIEVNVSEWLTDPPARIGAQQLQAAVRCTKCNPRSVVIAKHEDDRNVIPRTSHNG